MLFVHEIRMRVNRKRFSTFPHSKLRILMDKEEEKGTDHEHLPDQTEFMQPDFDDSSVSFADLML